MSDESNVIAIAPRREPREPTRASPGGFRLDSLELFNWGTFSGIAFLEPALQTALLTGANGSGKSTIVDALLTLLVPPQKRSYNFAAGISKRNERNERSYVRGAYGRLRQAEEDSPRLQFLRERDSYSALLAFFRDSRHEQEVSIAQIFWHENEQLQKCYVVAGKKLSIERDLNLASFGSSKNLRRALRAQDGVWVSNTFTEYSERFRRLLRIESENALSLFNQTVAIKTIGNLDDFVRDHMLERFDAEEKIQELIRNYENLSSTYEAIQTAKTQLGLLEPLSRDGDRYLEAQEAHANFLAEREALPAFLGGKTAELLETAIEQKSAEIVEIEHRIGRLSEELAEIQRAITALKVEQQKSDTGIRLTQIETELQALAREIAGKEQAKSQYLKLVRQVGLKPAESEDSFRAQHEQLHAMITAGTKREEALMAERDLSVVERSKATENLAVQQRELDSLQLRKNQIPERIVKVRQQLCRDLDFAESEFPFCGELIQVREHSSDWEGAIERLLHDFALRMLVPEKHYRRVNAYVNNTQLHGRLQYYRVEENRGYSVTRERDTADLIYKLALQPTSQFHGWLKTELEERFNYVCCNDMERFSRERQALTVTGLIKRGGRLHDKDDRSRIDDRSRYVLGWDNRRKIEAIKREVLRLNELLAGIEQKLSNIDSERGALRQRLQAMGRLGELESFSRIAADAERQRQQSLEEDRRRLLETADRYQELERQIGQSEAALNVRKEEQLQLVGRRGGLDRDRAEYLLRLDGCRARIAQCPEDTVATVFPRLMHHLSGDERLEDMEQLQYSLEEQYRSTLNEQQGRINSYHGMVTKKMLEFQSRYPAEVSEFGADISALEEYRELLRRIEKNELPAHEKRFKILLNDNVIRDISSFKSSLENLEEEIRTRIDELNCSLRRINYSETTYIELLYQPTPAKEIREFRQDLRACLPDVGGDNSFEHNEESFLRIKGLIDRFKQENSWTRKVTDVRNWLTFAASERWREDGAEKSHYSDSAGLSGGQKAKLAYTILASAIAYQYGLHSEDLRSERFCFVVVDEAFSKSDDTNSRYALELFKGLGLQLLLVTPLDKIHVVEPYVAAYHFVKNNERQDDSRLFNLSAEQYFAEKERFRLRSQTA